MEIELLKTSVGTAQDEKLCRWNLLQQFCYQRTAIAVSFTQAVSFVINEMAIGVH